MLTTRAFQSRLPSWVRLCESRNDAAQVEVDETEGVIRGVKLLGRKSPNRPNRNGRPISGVINGTYYSDDALNSGVDIFEGAKVRLNHPDRLNPNEERAVESDLGVIRNVRRTTDGLRGDLYYNRAHPFAARLVEDVKRRLGQWGFSPNALGVGRVHNGVYVVEELAHCRSIDLVSDPATTVNLWESKQVGNTITFRDLVDRWVLPKYRGQKRVKLVSIMEGCVSKKDNMMEADDDPMGGDPMDLGDVPVDEPAEGTDPEDALWSGFRATLIAVIDDDAMEPKAKVDRLKQLIMAHHSLKDEGGTEEEVVEEPPVPGDTEEMLSPEAKGKLEKKKLAATGMESASLPIGKSSGPAEKTTISKSRQNTAQTAESNQLTDADRLELARYRKRDEVVSLCEALDYTAEAIEIKALCDLTESDRRQFILKQKKIKNRPRTSVRSSGEDVGGDEAPSRGKSMAEGHTALGEAIKS